MPYQPLSSIFIHDLLVPIPTGFGFSAFSLPKQPCTILLSVECHLLPHCLEPTTESSSAAASTGVEDDWSTLGLGKSVNYSALGKELTKAVQGAVERDEVRTLEQLTNVVGGVCGKEYPSSLDRVDIKVERKRALLFSESVSVEQTIAFSYPSNKPDNPDAPPSFTSVTTARKVIRVNGIQVDCIIGLHPHERAEEQRLELDVEVDLLKLEDEIDVEAGFDYKSFGKVAHEYLSKSSFKTLESLAHNLSNHLLSRIPISSPQAFDPSSSTRKPAVEYSKRDDVELKLEIRKPAAIALAKYPAIRTTRTARDYAARKSIMLAPSADSSSKQNRSSSISAYIAIGTNLGDRIANIKTATNQLEDVEGDDEELVEDRGVVKVKRVSRLYESVPMYMLDQGKFVNGVIEIETTLSPLQLLLHLKRIENSMGRVKDIENGPRIIDLDLTLYGNEIITVGQKGDADGKLGVKGAGWLEVPHWGIGEREFVLRPLADLVPDLAHPKFGKTVRQLLEAVVDPTQPPALRPILPFPTPSQPLQTVPYQPLIMGILNVTPDSFSDGSSERVVAEDGTNLEQIIATVRRMIDDGADIIDIGGMSTRPGVSDTDVSVKEELARVIPVIQALRVEGIEVPISIDTFRAEVAEQAIQAGASCINDVRGGREEGMLEVMRAMDVPVVLMHTRGDSKFMLTEAAKDYSALGGVTAGVQQEMRDLVKRAEDAGIRRWNIILDPGIGFAKTVDGNLELLHRLESLFGPESGLDTYSVLVGGSRKGFIGTVLQQSDPLKREMGTAIVTARCTYSGKVDIVRVHEPGPSKDAIRMTRALKLAA